MILGHKQWSDDEDDGGAGGPRAKRARGAAGESSGGYASDHTAVTDYEEPTGTTPRVWTQQHLDAADLRVPPSMMTPPTIVIHCF